MGKSLQRALSGAALTLTVVLLLALSLAAPAAQGQGFHDRVIVVSYLNIKPAQVGAWLVTFKKHLYPALEEMREQGTLEGWHLFVPYIHHPDTS